VSGPFKRSGRFGLIGVFLVAAIIIVIAQSSGNGEANPKTTLALIFGVLAVFVIVLLVLQRGDLERAAAANVGGSARGAAEGGRSIENPTTMSEPELWAAMTVAPIDAEAVRARSQMWEASRRSQHLGWIVMALIFVTVPSMYLLESFVPLLIGGPLIALAAVYGSIRALVPGGELDRGYENVGKAMAPLGLKVTERPQVNIEVRQATSDRVGPKVRGALVLSGERHGHQVTVRLGATETKSTSEVTVGGVAAPPFEARSRDGRVRPGETVPEVIVAALAAVPNSTRWKRLEVEGGPEGIVVSRKAGGQADWLCDLWLAERLAAACSAAPEGAERR
jgi:hypothetical protein